LVIFVIAVAHGGAQNRSGLEVSHPMTIFLKAAMLPISPASLLPVDLAQATLIGRIWRDGPCVVAVRGGEVDIAETVATVAELFESDDALGIARHAPGTALGPVQALMAQALKAPADRPLLLAPCDLQAIKACGVTFAVSLLERVIEEQAAATRRVPPACAARCKILWAAICRPCVPARRRRSA
jgi:fumarylacetoacetate (FAA) hydrolase family protein